MIGRLIYFWTGCNINDRSVLQGQLYKDDFNDSTDQGLISISQIYHLT